MTLHTLNQKILHLSLCQGLGPISKIRMISVLIDNEDTSWADLATAAGLSYKNRTLFLESCSKINPAAVAERYQKKGIQWITILDATYPEYLKHIYNPPAVLFYKGNIQLLQENLLAVVGARENTIYGTAVLDKLLPEFMLKNIVTVSGLAKGIDRAVHQKTIELGGQTVGVVGTGLDICYPATNKDLQQKIGEEHLLLSEYPAGTKPRREHFPMRNRIIAGIALGTLVIEAKSRSGSLITANLALQEGRLVFTVPGNITEPFSEGANELIQQGAKCVLSAKDVLDELFF